MKNMIVQCLGWQGASVAAFSAALVACSSAVSSSENGTTVSRSALTSTPSLFSERGGIGIAGAGRAQRSAAVATVVAPSLSAPSKRSSSDGPSLSRSWMSSTATWWTATRA